MYDFYPNFSTPSIPQPITLFVTSIRIVPFFLEPFKSSTSKPSSQERFNVPFNRLASASARPALL
jgi:hypothetical protein